MHRSIRRRPRRWLLGIVTATVAVAATACPPPDPPFRTIPGPTPAKVVAVGPEGSTASYRPLSSDGRVAAYAWPDPTSGADDAYLWDATTGGSTRLTQSTTASDDSSAPVVSADGARAAFLSAATEVVPGRSNDGHTFFLVDTTTGTVEQVDLPPGIAAPETVALSAEGSVLLGAGGHVYRWRRASGFTEVSDPAQLSSGAVLRYTTLGAAISDNGRFATMVAWVEDDIDPATPGVRYRVEVHDLVSGSVDVAATSPQLPPPASAFVDQYFVPALATTDGGGVVYSSTYRSSAQQFSSLGIYAWDPVGRELTSAVGDSFARGFTASSDGNAVGYTGYPGPGAADNGDGFVFLRATKQRASAGPRAGGTVPVGISATAGRVLLLSRDPALVGPDAIGDTAPALYLWSRA